MGDTMMKKSTAKSHVRSLRERIKELSAFVDELEKDGDRPMFYPLASPPFEEIGPWIGVSWMNDGRIVITFNDEEITNPQAMGLSVSLFWGVFESTRRGNDPSDRNAFEVAFAEFEKLARDRCHQSKRRTP
jgi:hypothetical protein